jgi:hypothetical protein
MNFTESPTEQTTAITDVLVFLVALSAIGLMSANRFADPAKIHIWVPAFAFVAIASLLGALAHGIVFSDRFHDRVWLILNLCLGLAVSLFVVGVVYDLAGRGAASRAMPLMIAAGLLFFFISWRFPGIFFIFIVYEAAALVFALGAYAWLTISGDATGALWMTAGVLTSLVAAIIQTRQRITVKAIWAFDHNGLFHIVQAVGLLLLLRGILF